MSDKANRSPRFRKRMPVRFGVTPEMTGRGFTANVSARGVAIATNALPKLGGRLYLELTLGTKTCRAEGQIRWAQRGLMHAGTIGIRLSMADETFYQFIWELSPEKESTPAHVPPPPKTLTPDQPAVQRRTVLTVGPPGIIIPTAPPSPPTATGSGDPTRASEGEENIHSAPTEPPTHAPGGPRLVESDATAVEADRAPAQTEESEQGEETAPASVSDAEAPAELTEQITTEAATVPPGEMTAAPTEPPAAAPADVVEPSASATHVEEVTAPVESAVVAAPETFAAAEEPPETPEPQEAAPEGADVLEQLPDYLTLEGEGSDAGERDFDTPEWWASPDEDALHYRAPRFDASLSMDFGVGVILDRSGTTLNLSASGIAVSVPVATEPGEMVVFAISSKEGVCRGAGQVVWVREVLAEPLETYIGVRILQGDSRYHHLLDTLAREQPARASETVRVSH